MLKKGSDEFQRLLELGYPEEMILLAIKESKSKTFDNVSDLLHFKQAHYQKILQIPVLSNQNQNQKHGVADKKKAKDGKKSKKDKRVQEEENVHLGSIEVMQLAFGQQPQKAKINLSKKGQDLNIVEKGVVLEKEEEEEKKKPIADKNNSGLSKRIIYPDPAIKKEKKDDGVPEDVLVYLKKMKKDLTRENIDNSNELVVKLGDYIEQIKTDRSKAMNSLRRCLGMRNEFPVLLELKNMIFLVLTKIMSPKMNDDVPVDQKALEYCIMSVFKMRLLSSKQMGTIKTSCQDLYEKVGYPTDADIFDKLEEFMFYEGMGLSAPVDPVSEDENQNGDSQKNIENDFDKEEISEKKKISEEQKKKLIAKARAKEKWRESQEERERIDEERKYELVVQLMKNKSRQEAIEKDIEVIDSESEEEKDEMKPQTMEECLICMENIREIVFLPCRHFLTCSLCSPRVHKCPLCYKGIEENLKIYWS